MKDNNKKIDVDEEHGEVKKITHEERMVYIKELQELINCYNVNRNNNSNLYVGVNSFNFCSRAYSRKLFKEKLFELCSVIIQKYLAVNEIYFDLCDLEKLKKILNKILKLDYRDEKESMKKVKSLIKFSKIDGKKISNY